MAWAIIIASCGTGGAGGGGPIVPPPTAMPKINSFTPNTSTITISYTGMPNPGTVNFSWQTANGSTTFDGVGVAANDSKTISEVLEGKDYTLRVVNGSLSPAEATRSVVVVIDPTFQKMCGTSSLAWKTTRNTSFRISDGNLLELLQPSELDDTFTFYPYAKWKVDYGTLNPQPTDTEDIRFNSATSEIAIQPYDLQPVRKVEFTSPTTMTWSYTKNGSIYTRYFEKN